jgi:anti-sigma regulatory factor (Ser/Thr protein kinase)
MILAMGFGYHRNSGLLDIKFREFFIPTVLTAMANSMSIIVDGIIVGNFLGANALAAVNLVIPIQMLYTTVAVFLGMGAATVIAVAKGRREEAYANDIFTLVLSRLMCVTGVWISFVLAEAVTIMMIVVYYLYMKKKSAGRYKDILLLDNERVCDFKMLDLTIMSSIEHAVGVSEKTIEFLDKGGIEIRLCNKVGMVLEEMAVNTARYGYKQGKKQNYIDIRIKILEEEIIIVLRDDGEYFDPTKYSDSEKEEKSYLVGGIELVNAIAKKVEYSRVLGLNNTTITIHSGKLCS